MYSLFMSRQTARMWKRFLTDVTFEQSFAHMNNTCVPLQITLSIKGRNKPFITYVTDIWFASTFVCVKMATLTKHLITDITHVSSYIGM